MDGCGYLARVDNESYSANISKEFLENGLEVIIDYEDVDGIYSCGDGGVEQYKKIKIDKIERLDKNDIKKCGVDTLGDDYSYESCDRSCNLDVDCHFTCGCGAIKIGESCFDGDIMWDCMVSEVHCVDNKCVTGKEFTGENNELDFYVYTKSKFISMDEYNKKEMFVDEPICDAYVSLGGKLKREVVTEKDAKDFALSFYREHNFSVRENDLNIYKIDNDWRIVLMNNENDCVYQDGKYEIFPECVGGFIIDFENQAWMRYAVSC